MTAPYFGSDIPYSFMLLNENSDIRVDTGRLRHQDFKYTSLGVPKLNLQYIKLKLKAIPVF